MDLRGPAVALLLGTVPARAELLFEAYTGRHFNQPSDVRLELGRRGTELTFSDVAWDGKPFSPSPYYGYRFVYFAPARPWLGWSAEFLHSKAFAQTRVYRARGTRDGIPVDADLDMAQVVQAYAVTHGLNFITLNLQARARLLGGRLSPYAGAGAGPVLVYAESVVENGDHDTGYFVAREPGVQAFAGMRARLAGRWRAFLEYKFTTAFVRSAVAGGAVSSRHTAHNAVFGLGIALR